MSVEKKEIYSFERKRNFEKKINPFIYYLLYYNCFLFIFRGKVDIRIKFYNLNAYVFNTLKFTQNLAFFPQLKKKKNEIRIKRRHTFEIKNLFKK